MNLRLDTCALLWWWSQPEKLSKRSMSLIQDSANTVWVSAASAWEISTKHRIGKYPAGGQVILQWDKRLEEDGFHELRIGSGHALRAGSLPGEHRDPFDRMIAAQSILEGYPVLSPDAELESFGAERVW